MLMMLAYGRDVSTVLLIGNRKVKSSAGLPPSADGQAAGGALVVPVRAHVVAEVRRPARKTLGLQPQALEVSDAAGVAIVLVRRAGVEHVVVVDELHVAWEELHGDVVLGL